MSLGRRRRAVLSALVALWLGVLGPAVAVSAPSQVTVPDASEAWYASGLAGACATPIGCVPSLPTSPFPKGTLHVAVAAGNEQSRVYLRPDLGRLASVSAVQTAAMQLPVATDPASGSSNVAAAQMVACLVTQPFQDVEASTGTPPTVDCSVSAYLRYLGPAQNAFQVQLTPFFRAWAEDATPYGVAIVPAKSTDASSNWHVAFEGDQRSGVRHIMTTLTVGAGAQSAEPTVTLPDTMSPATGVAPLTPAQSNEPPADGTASSRPVPAPLVAAPSAERAGVPSAPPEPGGLVYLLPLLVLAGFGYLRRTFTADLRVRRYV